MPKSAIETTGQLREFLATMIVGVKNGTVDVDKASRITKLAAQINESLYAEIKIARVRVELGDKTAEPMGEMSIVGAKPDA
jgi:hypothetical protein